MYAMYPKDPNASTVKFTGAADARAAARQSGPGATVWNDRKGTFLYEAPAYKANHCQQHGNRHPCPGQHD